jgi:hypothetical protein
MNNKDITPEKFLKSFTCPHCQTLSLMHFDSHHFQEDTNESFSSKTPIKNILYIARCCNCGKKIVWIDNEYIYPNIVAEEVNPDLPESVKQLYNEAGLIYNLSPRAACALLRLAIEKLCHELGETADKINDNIAALVKKGLSPKVQKALDLVRVVGNNAVHPGKIAFDVDDITTAKSLMRLVNMIGQIMITDPKDIDNMYSQLPESTKKSIERRDGK